MSARDRLRRTRGILAVAAAATASLWALSVALLAVGVFAALDAWLTLPSGVRAPAVLVAATAGAFAGAWRIWEARGLLSRAKVALWVEERVPDLHYALVTLAGEAGNPAPLEAVVARARWGRPVARAAVAAMVLPGALLTGALAGLAVLPAGSVGRIGAPGAGDVLDARARGRAGRLTPLAVTVTPPAYTGRPSRTFEEPLVVTGMAGSHVSVAGRGAAGGLQVRLGDSALAVTGAAGRWHVDLPMPDAAVAVRLVDGLEERVLTLEPFPDSLPHLTLAAPAADTVFRVPPRGTVRLAAALHDDVGLASAWFEVVISSGEMESFSFRTAVVGRAALDGARDTLREAVLPLDALALQPGDVVHLRAVAADVRAPEPGLGASETRTWRVARTGEYDSLSLEGAPPADADSSLMSQRMLILMAEALERRRPRLARAMVSAEARSIARDQARLRRRVADIIFQRLGNQPSGEESEGGAGEDHPRTPEDVLRAAEAAASRTGAEATDFAVDETPVVAVNRPLLEAYNAMWSATRALELGEPDDALPHMRAALAAIQRARAAERVYLRGRPPAAVVDLRRVRLIGNLSDVATARRTARAALSGARGRLAARLEQAIGLVLAGNAAAAADSLLLLRVDALGEAPRLADALADAARALREGADPSGPLRRARQATSDARAAVPSLPLWSPAR